LFYNVLSGLASVLGGVLGYFVIGTFEAYLPFLLVVASSSMIYVAVADLIPQLQRRISARETLSQLGWLAAGLGLILVITSGGHGH
jgi:zinc and cadmium transporter